MAFLRQSLFLCKYYNPNFVKNTKVVTGGLYVKQCQIQTRKLHGEINPKTEDKLKKKDGIVGDFRIIYRAPYEIYCKVCYGLAVFSTTVFPTLFSTLLFTQGFHNFPLMFGNIELAKSSTEIFIFAGGLCITVAQIGLVIFRYPYRIYKSSSSDEYTMIYQHVLPWKNDKEELKAGELKKTEKSLMPWRDSLYEFRNRKAILLDNHFHRPVDLEFMMKSIKNQNCK